MLNRELLLSAYDLLESSTYDELQPLVKIAAAVCHTPIALVCILGNEKQFLRARLGISEPDTIPIEDSFCRHLLASESDSLIVRDARKDKRFTSNPYVLHHKLVFYAGFPIVVDQGEVIGSICVMDYRPRRLNKSQQEALSSLAQQANAMLVSRREKMRMREQVNAKIYKELPQTKSMVHKKTNEFIRNCVLESMQLQWSANYYKYVGDPVRDSWGEWRSRIHPQDRLRVIDSLDQALRSKEVFWSSAYRFQKGDNPDQYISVEDRAFFRRDVDYQPISFTAVMLDVSKQEDRKHQLDVFEKVINNTNDAILITEAEPLDPPYGPRIIYANARITEQTGYSIEEVIGQTPRLFQSPNVDKKTTKRLGERLRKWKKVQNVNLLNRKKNGEEFWVNLSIAPVADETGWYTHWISIQRDVTLTIAKSRNKEVIADIQKISKSSLDLKKILSQIGTAIVDRMEISHAEIWLTIDEHTGPEKITATTPDASLRKLRKLPKADKRIKELIQETMASGKNTFEKEPFGQLTPRHSLYGLKGYKSYLIPLIHGGHVIGCMAMLTDTRIVNTKRYLNIEFDGFALMLGSEIGRIQLTSKYRKLLEFAPDIICIAGTNGYFKEFNKAMPDILGYSPEELKGIPFRKLIHPDDLHTTNTLIDEIEDGEQVSYYENRYRHKDGHYVWLAWSATPADHRGNVFCVAKEVSEIVEARQEINRFIERYGMAMEATTDAIWEYNFVKDELIWEEGFRRNFGYLPGKEYELITWQNKVHPEDVDALMESVFAHLNDPSVDIMENEYRFRHMNGEYLNVVDRSKILRDEEGNAVRLIGAMQDVTKKYRDQQLLMNLNRELQAKNDKLAISNAELEQFAFVTSHDLQEPLRMITGFLKQLEKKYGDNLDEKAHTYIHYAVDGAKRMRRIILDLLEFNRVGKAEDRDELIDLNELVEEIRQLYRKRIKDTNTTLSIPEPLPHVKTRYVQLSRVFQNLIDNAIKYRRKGVPPAIEITYEDRDEHWYFEVKDNGIGIPKAYFEKVFVIFQRLSHEKSQEGTGMGLAITKKMVQNLGGIITVDSNEGVGSKFMFTIAK